MPIDNYILATAPIGAGMPAGSFPAVRRFRTRAFVVYYFRPTADGRWIFGGGRPIRATRPQTSPVSYAVIWRASTRNSGSAKVDYAWGGTLAITLRRLPFIRRLRPGVYVAAGYSGQGVAMAPFAGKVPADAIRGGPGQAGHIRQPACSAFPGRKAAAQAGARGRHDVVRAQRSALKTRHPAAEI